MKKVITAILLCLVGSAFYPLTAFCSIQSYDLLLKGGHLIDPKNGIDAPMDVAIANDTIAAVDENIPAESAQKIVDISGLYVTPGLIDIHSHNFYGTEPYSAYSNGFNALPPDGFTFRAGVTTVVDVGGAGWREFRLFKDQVIDRSQTRVLAFINIVGWGMKGNPHEQDLNDMDPKMAALVADQFPEIVGVKIAHYMGNDWEPIHRLVEAGEMASIPVMVDFGGADPPLSLQTLFMEKLRPGDIFTHTYANLDSREAIVDESYNLYPYVLEAQERGIIFDVGHGGASFNFKTAIPALEQGLKPNTISTDIHRGSMNAGMKDMLNVMSKFLNMGMTLQEVIEASTWTPAKVIQREELGHLDVGAAADIAVLNLREGEFGFVDGRPGDRMPGTQKLEAELTLRAGQVVWDLNGISARMWDEE